MMDYRENAGYVITDSCQGRKRVCMGVHLTASAIRYLEMQRPDGSLLGPLFQQPADAQRILVARAHEECSISGAAALIPTRWWSRTRRFPWEKSRPATPFAPKRLFRQHRRPWRGYGQPGACGQGALVREAKNLGL